MTSYNSEHPRRRSSRQCHSMSLRKGATFHCPKSPSSPIDDPILSIPNLLKRSPTCPKTLRDLTVVANEDRVSKLIDECFANPKGNAAAGSSDKEALPVPSFMLARVSADLDSLGLDDKVKQEVDVAADNHQHASDSGLGSSVGTSTALGRRRLRIQTNGLVAPTATISTDSEHSNTTDTTTAINKSFCSSTSVEATHFLGEYATKQIKKFIVEPILRLESLKEFHPLISDLPHRISDRNITCLRDLEKTLIFLAPARSTSAASYLNFCDTSIQCIHTTVDHLNEADQRRPTDRPYTNNYFVDLVAQVQQYARIMAATRQKEADGEELDDMDYSPDEKITLRGGPSQNGQPAELVREKDGKVIPIGGDAVLKRSSSNLSDTEDVMRSMARKRKCDIGKEEIHPCPECRKEFKRPCDLTKHTKTHSRPWKCPDATCKYHDLGWPTEKERDRHVNDKHSAAPPTFKCHFENCTYTSKRESNCKQHMEKSHGWEYVRSKSKNNQKKPGTGQTPQTPLIPTPTSAAAFPSMSTPLTSYAPSPSDFSSASNSRDASVFAGPSNAFHHELGNSNTFFDMSNTFTSPVEYNGVGNNAFDFSAYPQNINMSRAPYTPALTDGHVKTPNSSLTHSSPDYSLPPNSFEDHFTGHEMTFDNSGLYPPVADFFPQYNTQQPTPALSDLEYMSNHCMDVDSSNSTVPELSPHGQGDVLFYNSNSAGNLHHDEGIDTSFPSQGNDFTLFGEISGLPPASVGALFPELDDADDLHMHDGLIDDYTNTALFPSQNQ